MNYSRVPPFPTDLGELPTISHGLEQLGPYRFKTITPTFGCGVEVRQLDRVTPVRGSTVRGHLRFWWRATCGRQYTSVKRLWDAESALWGSSKTPSQVDIEITDITVEEESCWAKNEFYPAYALFPFQPAPPLGYAEDWKSLSFTIIARVRGAQDRVKEVETALWAWANFGGVGSRTRRGCGALFCNAFAPAQFPGADWIQQKLGKAQAVAPLWPRLTYEPILHPKNSAPLVSWRDAVQVLAEFRQYPPLARNGTVSAHGKPVTFGRSHWPEADSLRAQTGKGSPAHMGSKTVPRGLPAFPRAELGLPYQVKFKEHPDSLNDSEVLPPDSKRSASTVILRPLAIGPDGRRTHAMVLQLDAPIPKAVRVKLQGGGFLTFSSGPQVRGPGLASYPDSPMAGRSPQGSALEAFLNFAREKFTP